MALPRSLTMEMESAAAPPRASKHHGGTKSTPTSQHATKLDANLRCTPDQCGEHGEHCQNMLLQRGGDVIYPEQLVIPHHIHSGNAANKARRLSAIQHSIMQNHTSPPWMVFTHVSESSYSLPLFV